MGLYMSTNYEYAAREVLYPLVNNGRENFAEWYARTIKKSYAQDIIDGNTFIVVILDDYSIDLRKKVDNTIDSYRTFPKRKYFANAGADYCVLITTEKDDKEFMEVYKDLRQIDGVEFLTNILVAYPKFQDADNSHGQLTFDFV